MVDEQLVTKNTSESARQLGGECNFGHEIKHLFAQFEGVVDEVHVNRSLAAAGHAVQQGDGMLAHGLMNLFVGSLLLVTKGRWLLKHAAQIGKSVDCFLINLENATFYCLAEDSATHLRAFKQIVLAHLGDLTAL